MIMLENKVSLFLEVRGELPPHKLPAITYLIALDAL